MNIFQNIISAVGSFLSSYKPSAEEIKPPEDRNFKRSREEEEEEEDDVVLVDGSSPPKRPRVLQNRADFRNVNLGRRVGLMRTAASTQTEAKYQETGGGSRSESGDDWISLLDDDNNSLSPTKFKNTYKAPKHVRSPFKRGREIAPRSKGPLSFLMPRNRSMMTPTASNFQRKPVIMQKSLLSSSVDQRNGGTLGEGMNIADYQKLLGSVISSSAKETMRVLPVTQIKSGTTIDLTDDDETPVVDLTVKEQLSHSTPIVDLTKKKPVPVIKPDIIYINDRDDENLSPRQRVPRVNSLAAKIEKNKFTQPSLVSNGWADYDKSRQRLNELEAQHNATTSCGKKFSTEALTELLQKRIETHLRVSQSIFEEEEEEVEEKPVLTDDMLAKVHYAFNQSLKPGQVLVSKFKLNISRSDFMTLKNQAWLNDSVINFYMELIAERGETVKGFPSVYAFSTFFYPALKNGYDRVRRYTKKAQVDIFDKEIILVPIHLAVHWCMAKIDMKRKEIVYYDSMLQSNQRTLDLLMDYLSSEYKDKKKSEFDQSGWTTFSDKDIPVQKNGSDCGVFACTFGEYSARRAKFNFTQEDMPYMRKKMVYEILSGKLLIP